MPKLEVPSILLREKNPTRIGSLSYEPVQPNRLVTPEGYLAKLMQEGFSYLDKSMLQANVEDASEQLSNVSDTFLMNQSKIHATTTFTSKEEIERAYLANEARLQKNMIDIFTKYDSRVNSQLHNTKTSTMSRLLTGSNEHRLSDINALAKARATAAIQTELRDVEVQLNSGLSKFGDKNSLMSNDDALDVYTTNSKLLDDFKNKLSDLSKGDTKLILEFTAQAERLRSLLDQSYSDRLLMNDRQNAIGVLNEAVTQNMDSIIVNPSDTNVGKLVSDSYSKINKSIDISNSAIDGNEPKHVAARLAGRNSFGLNTLSALLKGNNIASAEVFTEHSIDYVDKTTYTQMKAMLDQYNTRNGQTGKKYNYGEQLVIQSYANGIKGLAACVNAANQAQLGDYNKAKSGIENTAMDIIRNTMSDLGLFTGSNNFSSDLYTSVMQKAGINNLNNLNSASSKDITAQLYTAILDVSIQQKQEELTKLTGISEDPSSNLTEVEQAKISERIRVLQEEINISENDKKCLHNAVELLPDYFIGAVLSNFNIVSSDSLIRSSIDRSNFSDLFSSDDTKFSMAYNALKTMAESADTSIIDYCVSKLGMNLSDYNYIVNRSDILNSMKVESTHIIEVMQFINTDLVAPYINYTGKIDIDNYFSILRDMGVDTTRLIEPKGDNSTSVLLKQYQPTVIDWFSIVYNNAIEHKVPIDSIDDFETMQKLFNMNKSSSVANINLNTRSNVHPFYGNRRLSEQ